MKQQVFIRVNRNEIANKKDLRKAFDELKDGRYLCTIEGANKRSGNQNAYLHGIVIPMVYQGLREAGYDDVRSNEDAKYFIKMLFLKKKIHNPNTDETVEIPRHTSELTTLEMNEFIEDIIKWGAEYLLIQIPYPNAK